MDPKLDQSWNNYKYKYEYKCNYKCNYNEYKYNYKYMKHSSWKQSKQLLEGGCLERRRALSEAKGECAMVFWLPVSVTSSLVFNLASLGISLTADQSGNCLEATCLAWVNLPRLFGGSISLFALPVHC